MPACLRKVLLPAEKRKRMSEIKAVVVDPGDPNRLALARVEAPWTEVGEIAGRLIERGYTGKAVLRVSGA